MAAAARKFDYVVIGAGPAGLALASNLVKRNNSKRVGVFEMRARPQEFKGSFPVVLNSRGLKTLQSLDCAVFDRVQAEGRRVQELHIVPNNRTVATVKTFGTCIMRDGVQQVLLEYSEALPEIEIHWEHKLLDIDFEKRECVFQTADGAAVTVQVERLIGADGNFSRVRRLCEQNVKDFSAELTPWGFHLRYMSTKGKPGQTGVDPAVHYVLGDMGYCCCQPDGTWNFSLRVLDDDEEFLTSDDATDEHVRKLREYAEEKCKVFAENLCDEAAYKSFYSCRVFNGNVVKCSRLNPAPWVCLVGDAAHAVMPATGEGINSGLEDALVLSDCIRDNVEDPFRAFNECHLKDAHALHAIALESKAKVVGVTPRQRAVGVMTTIGLGIAKKLSIIQGTYQDYMLGELAQTSGVKPYSELVEMDERQTRWLKPAAYRIAQVFRVPKTLPEKPMEQEAHATAGASQEPSPDQSSQHDQPDSKVKADDSKDKLMGS
eukprot:TRINITY_DN6293_c0_g1_i1.p1 TRINITY_DN6293_c0_g1~~TRINITY_DN6293_c0_g1_i1.p1  ORF type:complete len:489 (-),score=105.67 TRINITY_DN6293_c0_g1_i1:520-1986(-)